MGDGTRSYEIPNQTSPSLDPSHCLEDLREIREFFESRGIETKNTRIERYCNYLERSVSDGKGLADAETIFKNSVGQPFNSPIDWHLYVLREVHELMWILKGLKAHVPLGSDDKLGVIVGGRDFAALDRDSQSRNLQFEFRIASYFCQSDCEVDMSTETDVIVRAGRDVFYIECKRISSGGKLGARLSEARGQLVRRLSRKVYGQRALGCVAIDVTKVAFPHNGLTWAVSNEHSRDVVQNKLVEVSNRVNNSLSFESCPKLLCYWLQIHIPALILQPAPGLFASRFSSYHIPRPRLNKKDSRILTTFYKMFESVSKEDPRASPGQNLTPRNTGSFPAGTRFGLEVDRIDELLKQVSISENEQAEVIGSLAFDGIEDRFTFFEVRLLPGDLIDEWKLAVASDLAMGSLMLLIALYQLRYPHEESKRIALAGSLTSPEVSNEPQQ